MKTCAKGINDTELEEILTTEKSWNAVVFLQTSSISCDHFKPEFDAFSLARKDISCGRLDIDENPSITDKCKVTAVPTVLLFWKGKEVGRWEGPYSHEALLQRVGEAIERCRHEKP